MTTSLRRFFLPVLAGFVLFLLALGAGYLTRGDASTRDTLTVTGNSQAGSRGSVQALSGDRLRLSTEAGSKEFVLGSSTVVEALRPVLASSIAAGDWLNAGAIPNSQNLFTIVGLTLISQTLLRDR